MLNIIIANPITANQADFSPCQPRDSLKCKNAARKNKGIRAHTSVGSQPQNRSQAMCAQIEAKIKPPSVNNGNPIATERLVTSSNKFGLIFFKNGWTNAPILLRVNSRINPYNNPPDINDHINVLSLRGASFPCIHSGALNNGVMRSSDNNSPPLGPAIGGK